MAVISYSDPDVATMTLAGRANQQFMAAIQNSASHYMQGLRERGSALYETVAEKLNQIDDISRRYKAISGYLRNKMRTDGIYYVADPAFVQSPINEMRPYLAANPEVVELVRGGLVSGYNGFEYPEKKEEQREYVNYLEGIRRSVYQGMAHICVQEDQVDLRMQHWNDPDMKLLSVHDKSAIMSCWELQNMLINDEVDPTSPWGRSIL